MSQMPVFVYGHFDPLLIGFWVGLQLGWDPERAAEKHTHHEEREHMEAMNGIPLKSLGIHSPKSWVQVPKRTCICTSSFPPADK